MDGCRLRLVVEPDHVAVICRVPRSAGSAAALALTDLVSASFREPWSGSRRFGAPSVDLDGRDPDGFCAVVTVPIRTSDFG